MRIEDRFTVALPLDQAWEVLRDVERIAPCMPGAQLTEIEGDEYRGLVKVKLGAITAQYKGSVRFAEIDDAAHRMVLSAKGRETRGQGNASAEVVVALVETGAGTEVAIDTDLTISGKIAQFGRGVMADVSSKLLGEFSRCLEQLVSGDGAGGPGALLATSAVSGDELDDEGADPGMDLLAPTPAATNDVGLTGVETTASVASGVETTGAETTAIPTTGVESAGAEANGNGADPLPAQSATARPALRAIPSQPCEPLDLLALAGPSMVTRFLPAALVADLALLALVRRPVARWLLSAAGCGLVAAVVGSQRDR